MPRGYVQQKSPLKGFRPYVGLNQFIVLPKTRVFPVTSSTELCPFLPHFSVDCFEAGVFSCRVHQFHVSVDPIPPDDAQSTSTFLRKSSVSCFAFPETSVRRT